jgi:recombination protein RecT
MKVNNSFAPQIAQKQTFSAAITSAAMQNMMLKSLRDERAVARITSTLISAVSASDQLKNCEPSTIVAAALRGEGMGLIFENGYYVVPYGTTATYLLSYKGYIQLAMSTGFYADIDCVEVREGEIEGRDRRTGKPIVNLAKYESDEERQSKPVIGYYGYFELKNSMFRYEYWPMDRLLRHADRYSKAFSYEKFKAMQSGEMNPRDVEKLLNGSPWYDPNGGQDRMCRKTILRQLLNSGYAPLSPEVKTQLMEESRAEDEGVIPDFQMPERVIPTTGEVVEAAADTESTAQEAADGAVSAPAASDVKLPSRKENAAQRVSDANTVDYAQSFFDD